jgi:hypothetical protein
MSFHFHFLLLLCAVLAACSVPEWSAPDARLVKLKPSKSLDVVGRRSDKNSVGHGRNVALYAGTPSRFFFATHELGDIFSAADGQVITWYPDQVIVRPSATAPGVVEERQVFVTEDDVVVARFHLLNETSSAVAHRVVVSGDCRNSFDWRNKPGGAKSTKVEKGIVVLKDGNVFPELLQDGLSMVVGGSKPPSDMGLAVGSEGVAGAYRAVWLVNLPPFRIQTLTIACAIHPDENRAKTHLSRVLKQKDAVAMNRRDWQRFYELEVPQFECSDAGLNELYGFRWFLLKFSTAGGELGFFKYPVVMEGRQAFQTYCCYSAPFMAFDINWLADPKAGWGHIANMAHAAYADGRFPWYTSPRTNEVPLDHSSKTGVSLLPDALWKWYQIHGDRKLLAELYPAMKRNVEWWIRERDADGNGLFEIDHQLETGMDDLNRRWKRGPNPERYEAVDATTYALANLRAVAAMAGELGDTTASERFGTYGDRCERALLHIAWEHGSSRFLDRNPLSGELSDYTAITVFYPLFAASVPEVILDGLTRRYLLSPDHFWLPHPLPAISRSDPEFDPVKRYWAGPSWPAATTHVIEGFAVAAKRQDRTLLPRAAELLKMAARNHLQPRADFYERYDPFTGKPLSRFRDYMHSWWVDLYVRHIAGLEPQDDGSLVIDPLPLGLERVHLKGAPYRGHRIDVLLAANGRDRGLTVRCDGREVLRDLDFKAGGPRKTLARKTIFESRN